MGYGSLVTPRWLFEDFNKPKQFDIRNVPQFPAVGDRFRFRASGRVAEVTGKKDDAGILAIRFNEDGVQVEVPTIDLLKDAEKIDG